MDHSQRLAIIVTAQDLASGKLSKVRGELAGMGTSGKLAAIGLGSTMKVAQTGERALGNLKNRIGGLTSSIGPLLGVGGLLGLTSLLTSSIKDANDFGESVAKVTAVTNLATPIASAMVDTLDKWGIKTDRLVPLLAKLEKNVGGLAGTAAKGGSSTEKVTKATEGLRVAQLRLSEVEHRRGAAQSSIVAAQNRVADAERKLTAARQAGSVALSGAAAFQKQYGVSLLDSHGKIADANELLMRSADYFNSNASASSKATFMAKLWGKSWADLVPILSKGSAAIRAEEANAIHLTAAQVDSMAKFREAQRDFEDEFGDLRVKIGAELMPLLTTGLKEASSWFDSNGDKIAGFFHDAALTAGDAAKSAGEVFNALKQGWDSVPAPLREFLVKGLLADRAIHFLFGISPAKLVLSLAGDVLGPVISHSLGGLFGSFFQRGATPANPLFVADVAGGIGGKGIPGAAGAAAGSGLAVATAVIAPAAVAAAALMIQGEIDKQSADLNAKTKAFAATATDAELANALKGVNEQLAGMQFNSFDSKNKVVEVVNTLVAEQNRRALAGTRGPAVPGLYGPWTTLADALKSNSSAVDRNTIAFKAPTAAQARKDIDADRLARGIKDTGPSKSLDPRFRFLTAGHAGAKDVAVANAIATGFERGVTPAFKSLPNLERAIKVLTADQKTVGAKSSREIGADIARLKAELGRRTTAVAQAVKAKKMSTNLEIRAAWQANITVSSRAVGSSIVADQIRSHIVPHGAGGLEI